LLTGKGLLSTYNTISHLICLLLFLYAVKHRYALPLASHPMSIDLKLILKGFQEQYVLIKHNNTSDFHYSDLAVSSSLCLLTNY